LSPFWFDAGCKAINAATSSEKGSSVGRIVMATWQPNDTCVVPCEFVLFELARAFGADRGADEVGIRIVASVWLGIKSKVWCRPRPGQRQQCSNERPPAPALFKRPHGDERLRHMLAEVEIVVNHDDLAASVDHV